MAPAPALLVRRWHQAVEHPAAAPLVLLPAGCQLHRHVTLRQRLRLVMRCRLIRCRRRVRRSRSTAGTGILRAVVLLLLEADLNDLNFRGRPRRWYSPARRLTASCSNSKSMRACTKERQAVTHLFRNAQQNVPILHLVLRKLNHYSKGKYSLHATVL